jgi:CRP/FNR family transcriptional regulator, cyclic AMP receptor protein
MPDMLDLVAHLPEIELAPGDVLCSAGDHSGSIWVLVSGSLRVMKSETEVNRVERPGMSIGETSVLLGIPNTATVIAAVPTRLKVAHDGAALLRNDPELVVHVAAGLADRLNLVSTYLADLKQQYGEAPGLAMVGEVLSGLASHQRPRAVPGSRRDPDPEY